MRSSLLASMLWVIGCGAEEPRLIIELPADLGAEAATGAELSIANGRCGSAETVWTTAFRPGEGAERPPLLESGSYSAAAALLDDGCGVFAEGCVEMELPLGTGELVIPTTELDSPRPGCAPWLCTRGLCNRAACAVDADADTLALFDMEGAASGTIVDVVGGIESTFTVAPEEVNGVDGCGAALSGDATSYAELPGESALTLTEGAIDLFVWFPPDPPLGHAVGILHRTVEPRGVLSPFGLLWLGTGRVVLRTERRIDGIPKVGICSDGPMPTERWIHIGINVGPPGVELYVDGVLQAGEGRFDDSPGSQPGACALTGPPDPLPPGADPWVLMARAHDHDGEPAHDVFYGRIDQLRFSERRRDFTTFVGLVP